MEGILNLSDKRKVANNTPLVIQRGAQLGLSEEDSIQQGKHAASRIIRILILDMYVQYTFDNVKNIIPTQEGITDLGIPNEHILTDRTFNLRKPHVMFMVNSSNFYSFCRKYDLYGYNLRDILFLSNSIISNIRNFKETEHMSTLTISALEQLDSTTVYVMNRTPASERSKIVLSISDKAGNKESITVPVTWIPIDLTAKTTKQQLLESASFRQAVAMQIISIVSQETYDQIMQQPGAADELKQVLGVEAVYEDAVPLGQTEDDTPVDEHAQLLDKLSSYFDSVEQSPEDYTDEAVLNYVRRQGELPVKALQFIKEKCKTLRDNNVIVLKDTRSFVVAQLEN